jgi:hypothetical protein
MIRVLSPESITPIEPYLSRCGRPRAGLEASLDFALILLLREQEFVALHVKQVAGGPQFEWPIDPDIWAPHSLTRQGQFWLEADLAQAALVDSISMEDRPRDLFGLKRAAADQLEHHHELVDPGITTTPVLFKLWRDLLWWEKVAESAQRWAKKDQRAAAPRAYWFEAASVLSKSSGDAWAKAAATAERQAQPLLAKRHRGSALWAIRLTIRKKIEPGFARFLTTGTELYRAERALAMESFDEAQVPAPLRDLVPLAKELGVGDDPARAYFIGQKTKAKRRTLAALIQAAGPAMDEWLARFDHTKELPIEARAFFWLRAAGEEL